jgi:hypothetical protein
MSSRSVNDTVNEGVNADVKVFGWFWGVRQGMRPSRLGQRYFLYYCGGIICELMSRLGTGR